MDGNTVLRRIEQGMRSIGYRAELLRRDYEYADLTGASYDVRPVALAGFAQSPPSYRNVCIGVIVSNGMSGAAHVAQHRALGAPMIFEIGPKTIDRWKVTKSGDPELKEEIVHDQIERVFAARESEWNPERIFRAKAIGADTGPVQLDFFDAGLMPTLEGIIHKKLDRLLRNTLAKISQSYEYYNHRKPNSEDLFRLVFRFIAAKVLRDREHLGGWDSDDGIVVLKAVEDYYNAGAGNLPLSTIHRREFLDMAWKSILSAFLFQNLSVDDLAFIYENTFITKETRKTFGTHSTPPRVAEYIVHKLPFQDLPPDDRHVLEPCAGHGIFLVSAMRRLRELLPSGMSDRQRHNYFVRRLVGIEIDTFALEVCRLSLMLADYPNPDGWRLYPDDVYDTNRLEEELKNADVVLCNPPFEDFTPIERNKYGNRIQHVQKPAEILRRILSKPPNLLGIVLPLVFNSGVAYRDAHRQLAESYGQVELVVLPEVFNYSDVPVVLLLASDRREQNIQVAVTCRTIRNEELDTLLKEESDSLVTTEIKSVPQNQESTFSLWVPRLSRIWNYLAEFPKLEYAADIHRGVNWKSRGKEYKRREQRVNVISDKERPGYRRGVARAEDCLMQYRLIGQQYLSLRPEDQYDNAYKYHWDRPKVACNSGRLSRGPWRIGAVADPTGIAFSQEFFALWLTKPISIYALAALLNSPVVNAYSFDKDQGKHNRVNTLRSLPIPSLDYLDTGGQIDVLSRELHSRLEERHNSALMAEEQSLRDLLLKIDAAILQAYDLPPALERELLDTFQGVPRPVPFEFNGYYPPNFTAYIPLHELISEEFQEARADRLLERLSPVYDPKISEMLTWLSQD